MSRREFGSIATVKPGVQRVRYWADLHDGRGYARRSKTVRGTKREAAAWLAQQHVDHGSDGPSATVRDIWDTWYHPDIQERLAPRTLTGYERTWRSVIEPRWADVPVGDVRPRAVQEWLLTLKKNSAKMAMKMLSPMFDAAVRYEVAETNVFALRYRMPTEEAKLDGGVYTLDECVRIARRLEGDPIEAAYILAAFGGCRPGEALAPSLTDVDMVEAPNGMRCALVSIHDQVDEHGRLQGRVKNRQSERYAVIPWPWSARIEAIAREQMWLTGNRRNTAPMGLSPLRKRWEAAIGAMPDVEYHLFRNLRPSWRTYMSAELGVRPETLEKLMGHGGHSVTERHYLRPQAMQFIGEVSEAFAGRFGTNWD